MNFTMQRRELSSLVLLGPSNTPPSSLMDSAASPKKKTSEGEGIGVCSLAHNTSKVEGRAGTLGWDSED